MLTLIVICEHNKFIMHFISLKKIIFFVIFLLNCCLLCESYELDQLGAMPLCQVECLNLSVKESLVKKIDILIVKDSLYRRYKLKDVTTILNDTFYDPHRKTVVFAHGFVQDPFSLGNFKVAKAYTQTRQYNVLMIDASQLLNIDYMRSVMAVRVIGYSFGKALASMYERGFNIETLRLVGHSLGAHVMGFCGRSFHHHTGKMVPSIIALDPAGPCYGLVPPKRRLNKSDAKYVQVIHTNGGLLGLIAAIGHVDFYINGGRIQPKAIYSLFTITFCDHQRAVELWQAVIMNPGKYFGKKCSNLDEIDKGSCLLKKTSLIQIDPDGILSEEGVFLVSTTATYPFYLK